MIDVGLVLSYLLLGACALIAIGMPLIKAFGDPESLKKIGYGFGSLLVLFLVSYFTSSSEPMGDASVGTTKLVGAGLTMFYIVALAAVAGIIYTEIKKAIE